MNFTWPSQYDFLTTSQFNVGLDNTLVYFQILGMKSLLLTRYFRTFWLPEIYVRCTVIPLILVGFYFLTCLQQKLMLEMFLIILQSIPLCFRSLSYEMSPISNYILLLSISFYCVTIELIIDVCIFLCLAYQLLIYTDFFTNNKTVYVILAAVAFKSLGMRYTAYVHALFISCECLFFVQNKSVNLLHILIILAITFYMNSFKYFGHVGKKYLRQLCGNVCSRCI